MRAIAHSIYKDQRVRIQRLDSGCENAKTEADAAIVRIVPEAGGGADVVYLKVAAAAQYARVAIAWVLPAIIRIIRISKGGFLQ